MKKRIQLMALPFLMVLIIITSCDSSKKETLESPSIGEDQLAQQASDQTMEVAMAFMSAMGQGDMETMQSLMHEDMVWQNAGDSSLPWIGPWYGKKSILEDFMPKFGANFQTVKWEPDDAFASGNTAAFFGQMIGRLTKSGLETEEFTYALRVKVKDGKVILWNWFEDSYEVAKAYHAE